MENNLYHIKTEKYNIIYHKKLFFERTKKNVKNEKMIIQNE